MVVGCVLVEHLNKINQLVLCFYNLLTYLTYCCCYFLSISMVCLTYSTKSIYIEENI